MQFSLQSIFSHACDAICRDNTTFDVINVSSLEAVMFKVDCENETFFSVPLNDFELE